MFNWESLFSIAVMITCCHTWIVHSGAQAVICYCCHFCGRWLYSLSVLCFRRPEYVHQRKTLTARFKISVSVTSTEVRRSHTPWRQAAARTHTGGWRPFGNISMTWVRTWSHIRLFDVLYVLRSVLEVTLCLHHAGQWKQCCDDLMKIELPSPRKPAPVTPKQGSLYHEMGKASHWWCHARLQLKKKQKAFLVT